MRDGNGQKTFRERLLEAVMLNDAIVPAFQPIIDLSSGGISSLEVLARWEDSKVGMVNPNEFIPLVEDAGLLDHMTDRLMIKSCTWASAWGGDFRLSFNLSHRQFFSADLLQRILQIASITRFPADRLQIEISESEELDDLDRSTYYANSLKDAGIRVLLDDFGAISARRDRLQSIPFDEIKVDRSFIQSIVICNDIKNTARALIGLGHSLGILIVAEGVENIRQFNLLKRLGFDYGQGYYFSRPVFQDLVPGLLANLTPPARSRSTSHTQSDTSASIVGPAASHGP